MKRKPKSALQKRIDNHRSPYWKKRADALWGEYIHMAGCCAMAGTEGHSCAGVLEAHHLITRSTVALRHEPMNGLLLCTLGHKYCKHQSPHSAPLGFADWLLKHRPIQYAWAKEHKWTHGKPDYKGAAERLATIIEQRKAERSHHVPSFA